MGICKISTNLIPNIAPDLEFYNPSQTSLPQQISVSSSFPPSELGNQKQQHQKTNCIEQHNQFIIQTISLWRSDGTQNEQKVDNLYHHNKLQQIDEISKSQLIKDTQPDENTDRFISSCQGVAYQLLVSNHQKRSPNSPITQGTTIRDDFLESFTDGQPEDNIEKQI